MAYDGTGFYHPNPLSNRFVNRNTTLRWWGSDLEEVYDPEDNLYSPYDIEYKLNSRGFRCDEFDRTSDVMFLGCSVTEGIGVKQEETWAYRMLESIRHDVGRDIPYFNLGIGGAGLDAIVRSFYHYRKKLQPKLVIAFMPGYRREQYHLDNNTWDLRLMLPQYDEFMQQKIMVDNRTIVYETQKNMSFMDLMLTDIDAKMIWAFWGDTNVCGGIQTRSNSKILFDRKARDKMHPGPAAHAGFADELYRRHKNMILEKLS